MYIDNDNFVAWMERIMDRLDMQDKKIDRLMNSHNCLNGEKLLDNQDLCFMLPEERHIALSSSGRKILLSGKRHTQAYS